MKIAVPTCEVNVDDHFGHCEFFTVFTANEKKEIIETEIVKSPVGCGCKSNISETLSNLGVTIMLAGNMGQGAVNVLNQAGIEVFRGCSGNVKEVADSWLIGNIQDSGDACHSHECH